VNIVESRKEDIRLSQGEIRKPTEGLTVKFSSYVGVIRDVELFEKRVQGFFKEEGWTFVDRIYKGHPSIKGKLCIMSFKK